ncbi:MAG: DUF4019 domain-containing protein [Opitutaceae bacterium]|nr:DUF4019 domain-containing protein [Opitutaceae bacterium]
MKTLPLLLVLVTCLWSGSLAYSAEQKPLPNEVKSTAISWMELLDKGQYSDSWKQAVAKIRSFYGEKDWSQKMTKLRQPLGKAEKRELAGSNHTDTRPGMPPGDYWVLEFNTKFEKMPAAVEEVTLIPDRDGKYRVFAFAIRPASS